MKRIMLVSGLIMMLGLAGCGGAAEKKADERNVSEMDAAYHSITVNSSEKVSVVPDIAQIVYAVRTKETEAADCQQKNAEAVGKVIALLKELQVEESSVQTSDYSMNPIYSYSNNTQKLTGYEAVTTLTVSDLPIDNLDTILAKSVSGGVNTVQSITYQASGYDKSYQEALTKAMAAAYAKAQVLAQAAGAKVGNVVSIQETGGYTQARISDYARTGMMNSYSAVKEEAKLMDAASMMPGEIQVEAGIVVEYELSAQE